MRKIWINGSVILLIVMSLSGCRSRNIQTSSQNSPSDLHEQNIRSETSVAETNYQFPVEYVKNEGRVNFNVQIIISADAQIDNLAIREAVAAKIDNEKIYRGLFGHTEVENEQMIDLNNDDGSKGTAYYYNGSHGESLSITDRSFYFHDNLFNYISNAFRLEENTQDYNANLYRQEGDLDFATRKRALESVLQELSSLGIRLDDHIDDTCYVLDHQTLMQEESAMDINGNRAAENYKGNWDEKDDCYYFCIRQTIDGLPVTHEYADAFGYVGDSNAPIQAIVSQNGIEMLTVDKVFDLTDHIKKVKIANFDGIALSVKEKYEELLTDSTYTVTRAELYYLSIKREKGKYEVKPVWVFDITEHVNHLEQTYSIQMIIDAQTGEEIIL